VASWEQIDRVITDGQTGAKIVSGLQKVKVGSTKLVANDNHGDSLSIRRR